MSQPKHSDESAAVSDGAVVEESRASRVLEAMLDLAEETELDRVLQRVIDVARELVGARYAALGVISEDGSRLSDFVHSGMPNEVVEAIGPLPTGGGILGELLTSREPLRLADLSGHPSSVGFPPYHPPMSSFLGVPIGDRKEVVGNLYLTEKIGAREFTAADQALVEAFATQAAGAIDKARRYEREQRMVSRMRSLVEANLTLTRALQPDVVLQTLVDIARDLAGAEYAALGILSADGRSLESFIHSGMDEATVEAVGALPTGRGVMEAVMVSGAPIRVARLADHPASVGFPPGHPPMDAFLGVPIEAHGRVFGNIYLTNKIGAREFDAEDELVVTALAAQASVAIQNAAVHEREQELVAELRELNEAKSEFVSTVSHELRSPLAALIGLSSTVRDHRDALSPDDLTNSLDAIGRQALRLNRLVGDLLDLSRIESGRLDIDADTVELGPLFAGAAEAVAVTTDKDISVAETGGLAVMADPGRLDQIVVNLVANAVRHGGQQVDVSADREPEDPSRVRIVVADDGPGVPDELVERVFDRFARGTNPGGSGLGLAIGRALAEAMGGSLTYERVAGSTRFAVVLPAVDRSTQGQPPAQTSG